MIERNSETPSFEELAASQGVGPVMEFDRLLGHPSTEDESVDDFSACFGRGAKKAQQQRLLDECRYR